MKPLMPPPALPTAVANLPIPVERVPDTLGQLAEHQHHRSGCGSNGGIADDLHPLRYIQIQEAVQQTVRAFDEALDRGIEIIAQLLSKADQVEVLRMKPAATKKAGMNDGE